MISPGSFVTSFVTRSLSTIIFGIPRLITAHAAAVFARLIAIWFGTRFVISLSP